MAMASDPVIHAPLDTSRWSTLVSPFVHAKTKEIFERTTHGRILQVYDGTPETVKDWVNYVVKNMPPGIKVSVQSFSWAPLGHRVSEPPRQVTTPAVRIPEPSPASVVDVDGEQVDVSASNESSPVSTVVDGEQVGVSASTESSPSTVVDGKQVDISSEPSSAADSSTSAKATANPPTPDEAFEELVRAKTRAFLEAFGHIPKTGGAEKQSSKV